MIRVIMHGCNGKMGQVITGLCKEDPTVEIVAGIDVVDNRENGYPVFTEICKYESWHQYVDEAFERRSQCICSGRV